MSVCSWKKKCSSALNDLRDSLSFSEIRFCNLITTESRRPKFFSFKGLGLTLLIFKVGLRKPLMSEAINHPFTMDLHELLIEIGEFVGRFIQLVLQPRGV